LRARVTAAAALSSKKRPEGRFFYGQDETWCVMSLAVKGVSMFGKINRPLMKNEFSMVEMPNSFL